MQYMLLIYNDEAKHPAPGSPEMTALMKGYMEFTQDVREKGMLVAGEPLQGVSSATTVRVRDGKNQITDGPFAETKEQLGGFYILECEDLDQAIAHAQRIPTAKFGSIEIRPVMVFG